MKSTENCPPLKASIVYDQYIESTDDKTLLYENAAFGKIVKQVFPSVKSKSIYHPQKRFCAYIGIQQASVDNDVSLKTVSESEFVEIGEKTGFKVVDFSNLFVTFVFFTNIRCDGQTILKEVCIDLLTYMVTVKFGGKNVDINEAKLPAKCLNLSQIQCLLKLVSSLRICSGYPSACENTRLVTCNGVQPTANLWSVVCKGFVQLSSKSNMCEKCSTGIKKIETEPRKRMHPIESEHSYCKVGYQSIISPKKNSSASYLPNENISTSECNDICWSDMELDSSEDDLDKTDPSFTPTKHKKPRVDEAIHKEKIDSIFQLIDDACPSLDLPQFRTLMLSQLYNSEKPKKSLRRWDPR